MRIAIFGGTGFIGRHVASRLALFPENEVLVISRSGGSSDIENVEHIASDWASIESHEALKTFGPQVLVNVVGGSHPRMSVGKEALEIARYLLPFFEVIERLERTGLSHIVFCSSAGAIYESGVSGKEKSVFDSAYQVTKMSSEAYLSSCCLSRGLSAISLRISNPVGFSEQAGLGVVNHFSRAILSGEKVQFVGDYKSYKDYVDVEDVADAVCAATLLHGSRGVHDVVDVGSGFSTSAENIYELLKHIEFNEIPNINRYFEKSGLDLAASRALLDWEPKRNIISSIESVFRSHQLACEPPNMAISGTKISE